MKSNVALSILIWSIVLLFPFHVDAYNFDDVIAAYEKDSGRINPMRMLDRYKSVVKQLTGMEVPNDITIEEKTRGKAREEFLEHYLKEQKKYVEIESEIKGYEYFLKRLNLFEEERDLKEYFKANIYKYTEGLYMWNKKKLVLMKGSSNLAATMTLLHELTHAAQDSVSDFEKLHKLRQHSADATLSLQSLIEGQAVVMELLLRINKNIGDESVEKVLKEVTKNYKQMLVDNNTESILDATQIFPYTYGYLFVANQYMATKNKDFKSMYKRLPISTEQVLHYNKYRKNEKPQRTILEKKKDTLNPSWKKLYSTTLGEYYIQTIYNLSLKGNKKLNDKAASGWGGDYLCIFEMDGKKFFIWDTLWDRSVDAKEFLKRYSAFVKKRVGKKKLFKKKGFNFVYPNERPDLLVKRIGKRVIIIEGEIPDVMLNDIKSKLKI